MELSVKARETNSHDFYWFCRVGDRGFAGLEIRERLEEQYSATGRGRTGCSCRKGGAVLQESQHCQLNCSTEHNSSYANSQRNPGHKASDHDYEATQPMVDLNTHNELRLDARERRIEGVKPFCIR